jgi:CHAD domain-containing protein
MPFREVASSFQPDELDKLNAAFDAALQQLLAFNGGTDAEIELLRKKLAQHILASASTGQRDVEVLKENALRALMKRPPTVKKTLHLFDQTNS